MLEREYIIIRDSRNFSGTYERPIFDIIIQTNKVRRPIDTSKIKVGEKIWLKWKNGPIIMNVEIDSWEEGRVEDGDINNLRVKTKNFPTYKLNDYWNSLEGKKSFFYVIIYLKNSNYIAKPIQPNRTYNRNTWIVIDNIDVKKEWFPDYIEERINDSIDLFLDKIDSETRYFINENEDVQSLLGDISNLDITPKKKKAIAVLYQRNAKLIAKIKALYKNKCQICGFTFKKKNLELYSEVHHIKSLGEKGSDSLSNLINVCANCHRMLHYAKIEYKKLTDNSRDISINGKHKSIKYLPKHFELLNQ